MEDVIVIFLEFLPVYFVFFVKDHLTFFFSSVLYCYFYLHAVVYKVLAAELALHCSYAETLWSEVPLYVHPVYWMQNEDQYYRPLMIVYLFLADHAFFVWQYSVVLPGSILRCVRKKKKKGVSDGDVGVCRSKLLRLPAGCPPLPFA